MRHFGYRHFVTRFLFLIFPSFWERFYRKFPTWYLSLFLPSLKSFNSIFRTEMSSHEISLVTLRYWKKIEVHQTGEISTKLPPPFKLKQDRRSQETRTRWAKLDLCALSFSLHFRYVPIFACMYGIWTRDCAVGWLASSMYWRRWWCSFVIKQLPDLHGLQSPKWRNPTLFLSSKNFYRFKLFFPLFEQMLLANRISLSCEVGLRLASIVAQE